MLSYPMLRYFDVEGKVYVYEGKREMDDLINFASKNYIESQVV